jgi:hypothetical protein
MLIMASVLPQQDREQCLGRIGREIDKSIRLREGTTEKFDVPGTRHPSVSYGSFCDLGSCVVSLICALEDEYEVEGHLNT